MRIIFLVYETDKRLSVVKFVLAREMVPQHDHQLHDHTTGKPDGISKVFWPMNSPVPTLLRRIFYLSRLNKHFYHFNFPENFSPISNF